MVPASYTVFFTVTAATEPDFTVNPATPESLQAGHSVTFTTQVAPVNGFSGPFTLSSPGVDGVSLTFSPATTAPLSGGAQTVTATVTAAANAASQTEFVPIVALGENISHLSYVPVSVQGGGSNTGLTVSAAATPNPSRQYSALARQPGYLPRRSCVGKTLPSVHSGSGRRLAVYNIMKLIAAIALAFALSACSPTQDERAQQQAHQTAEQAKHDAKKALADAKVEAERANRALDKDLNKAREKIRGAIAQPNDAPPEDHR
jgi:ribosomal protein S6E (S10)